MTALEALRKVADTILYEGYVLYPYRASAPKNRSRWQFGVLMPQAFTAADPSEDSAVQTECVLEETGSPSLRVLLRFLQVQRRTIEFEDCETGECHPLDDHPGHRCGVPWDEAVEHEIAFTAGTGGEAVFRIDGGEHTTPVSFSGRAVRRREPLMLKVSVSLEPLPGPWGARRMRVRVENLTTPPGPLADRTAALPYAPIAVHCIVAAEGARFLSMVDHPEWSADHVAACRNTGTWPVLGGSPDLLLSSPIILYDDPQLAPESPGDLFDATEIDEILTLRTLALTDAEKAEARATDPRAATVISRAESLDAAAFERMHGVMRKVPPRRPEPASASASASAGDPYSELFGADTPKSPRTIVVAGAAVGVGSTVRLRPGARRADAQDMFLAGRVGVVEAVLHDVEDRAYLAVSLRDDPGRDVQICHGRFLYFTPEEVEPLPEEET